MLDKQALTSVPNCLDVGGRNLTIIVLGRRPSYGKCGQTSHLASSSPENKASDITASVNQTPPLPATDCCAASTKCMPTATSPVKPSTLASAVVERAEGNGWSLVGVEGRSRQRDLSSMNTIRQRTLKVSSPKSSVREIPRPRTHKCLSRLTRGSNRLKKRERS